MSFHSYSRCWLHLVWATKNREPVLNSEARTKLSAHLHEYAKDKDIYMKINFANPDHVHSLIDLPTNLSIENAVKLFKEESSYWVNQNRVIPAQFRWGRRFGAFSVSQSRVGAVCRYIAGQERHHRGKAFEGELQEFVMSYGLIWREEKDWTEDGE